MALMQVRYRGLSDFREMSKEDLAGAGVHVDSDLRWNRLGSVYIEDPSEDLLALFQREGTFDVSEVDAQGRPEGDLIIKHEAVKADDTGATVKDGVTGQVSTKPGK